MGGSFVQLIGDDAAARQIVGAVEGRSQRAPIRRKVVGSFAHGFKDVSMSEVATPADEDDDRIDF